ncbi:hypothetical protein [Actinomadura sp. HBU206391]|uniref:hypothetical protein n=1 Tax=Actinomadura sp. HBU206391 TaxID=2731692 RepID=UPI001650AC1E|nr:hypothetical protein [Actinomadura sp. HBU206391]MBC6457848.1 hypothetical protein [Actinomadura sp. HBU206391]
MGAGAVGALVFVGGPVAQADTPTPSPTTSSESAQPAKPGKSAQDRLAKRAKRMCARADRVEKRVDRLVKRLSAGPGTRGSVQRLQKRAATVRSKDAARADILDGQVRIRQSRLNTLKLRQQNLPKVDKWCDSHGFRDGSAG